jgi:hypothetical protein
MAVWEWVDFEGVAEAGDGGKMRDDSAYQQPAKDCLKSMKGKRFSSVVPLDDINGKYKRQLGDPPINTPGPVDMNIFGSSLSSFNLSSPNLFVPH